MRVIILAGGKQERFAESMPKSTQSKHKHLVSILDEPILHRTIRLLVSIGCQDIVVVTPLGLLDQYSIFQSPWVKYIERSEPIKHKLLEAELFLSNSENNLIILGDVFFTRRTLQKMLEPLENSSFAVYCRHGRSNVNAKTWGEIFAITITPETRELIIESARIISLAFSEGRLHRDNIWEVVKIASNVAFENLGEHPVLPSYIEINDFTDDIDYANDIELIIESLPKDFESALDKLSELYEVIYSRQIQHDLLRTEHDLLRTEHDLLRTEHDSLRTEHDSLRTEHDLLRTEHDLLRTEHDSLLEARTGFIGELLMIEKSVSWRITEPLRGAKRNLVKPLHKISRKFRFNVKNKITFKQFFLEMWRYFLARINGISHDEWVRAFPSDVFRNLPEHHKAIHIGGHLGREYDAYEDVLFIEPIPKYARYLRSLRRKVIEASCCGDTLYITTYEQGSSNLKPLQHEVKSMIKTLNFTLDDINDGSFDLLVMDVQGSEINVLKSGALTFQSIVVECSIFSRYEGAPTKREVIEFLESKNYSLECEYQHGDDDIYDLCFTKCSTNEPDI